MTDAKIKPKLGEGITLSCNQLAGVLNNGVANVFFRINGGFTNANNSVSLANLSSVLSNISARLIMACANDADAKLYYPALSGFLSNFQSKLNGLDFKAQNNDQSGLYDDLKENLQVVLGVSAGVSNGKDEKKKDKHGHRHGHGHGHRHGHDKHHHDGKKNGGDKVTLGSAAALLLLNQSIETGNGILNTIQTP